MPETEPGKKVFPRSMRHAVIGLTVAGLLFNVSAFTALQTRFLLAILALVVVACSFTGAGACLARGARASCGVQAIPVFRAFTEFRAPQAVMFWLSAIAMLLAAAGLMDFVLEGLPRALLALAIPIDLLGLAGAAVAGFVLGGHEG